MTAQSRLVVRPGTWSRGHTGGLPLQLTQGPRPGQGHASEVRKPFLPGGMRRLPGAQLEGDLGPERCQPGRWGRSWPDGGE